MNREDPLTESMMVSFLKSDRGPKSMDVKFIPYLNELSISITSCRQKQIKNSFNQITSLTDQNQKTDKCETGSLRSTSTKKNRMTTYQVNKLLRDNRQGRERDFKENNKTMSENFKIISGQRNRNGMLKGKVRLEYTNGEEFIGHFQNNQKIQGQVIFPSGLKFQGSFKDDSYHGKGTLLLTNGTKIQTQWKDGIVEPRGRIEYKNGDIYVGSMHRFKKDGFGELVMKDKRYKYVGEFKNGNIHGWGILYQRQKVKATGNWRRGVFIHNEKLGSQSSQDSL